MEQKEEKNINKDISEFSKMLNPNPNRMLNKKIDKTFKDIEERERHIEEYEKRTIDEILFVLNLIKNDYMYSNKIDFNYDSMNHPRFIEVKITDDRPLNIEIEIGDGAIGLRSVYPFRSLISCIPYISLKSLMMNRESDIFKMIVDISDGEIGIQHIYGINNEFGEFNDIQQFFTYLEELIHVSLKEYVEIQGLCVGKLPGKYNDYFRHLIKWTAMFENDDAQEEYEINYEKDCYEDIVKKLSSMSPKKSSFNCKNDFSFNIMRDFFNKKDNQ